MGCIWLGGTSPGQLARRKQRTGKEAPPAA